MTRGRQPCARLVRAQTEVMGGGGDIETRQDENTLILYERGQRWWAAAVMSRQDETRPRSSCTSAVGGGATGRHVGPQLSGRARAEVDSCGERKRASPRSYKMSRSSRS